MAVNDNKLQDLEHSKGKNPNDSKNQELIWNWFEKYWVWFQHPTLGFGFIPVLSL